MTARCLLATGAVGALCLAATAFPQTTQIVTPQPASQSKAPGSAAQIHVQYTTSNADATLTGLGLRVHWDSTKLTFGSLANVLSTSLMAQGQPQGDGDDLDGDASTDTYVLVAWADTAGNWPGSVPVRLFTLNVTTAASFSGTTTVRFTASSTAAGYTLAATSATISAAATGPTIAEAGSLRWIIPTSAHVGGLAGTNWVSDVVLHNPGSGAASANAYFLPSGQDNSGVRGITLSVPANGSLKLADAIEDTFGRSSASGALLIGSNQQLIVTSRTFNNAASGTYGQYVPGFPLAEAVTGTASVRLIQLTKSASYRTNIGFANATGRSLPVQVELFRADGGSLGTRTYTVQPYGYFQETDIIAKVTGDNIADGYAVVRSSDGGASYFTYASVIDNRTGDPITVIPVAATGPSSASRAATPAAEPTTESGAAAETTVTLLSDGFEGSFPGVWQLWPEQQTTGWGRSTHRAASGMASAWCAAGGSSPQPAGAHYVPNMNTWIFAGPFDLSDATAASMEFDLWIASETNVDLISWAISLDDNTYYGPTRSGLAAQWEHITLDFASVREVQAIGAPRVWVAFIFRSDYSIELEGAYVDNVVVTKRTAGCTAPAAPALTAPSSASSGASYTLSWTATSPDANYELEEATNSSFEGATRETVTGTSKILTHAVSARTTFYARVRALFACGGFVLTSPWSNVAQTVVSPGQPSGAGIYVPGAAALGGVGGTNWKTDLEVHNPGHTRAEYTLALLRRDQENISPATRSFALDGGRSARYEDVLRSVFGFTGAATLRISPTSGSVVATARTFNDQAQGTYGQFTAGVPHTRVFTALQEARLVHLSRSADPGRGFRTNLGLVNTTGSTISLEVKLFAAGGTLLGTRTYSLRAYESIQRNDVFNEVGAGDVDDGFATVRCTTEGGRFLAFASVIDNRSGDPIYVPAR